MGHESEDIAAPIASEPEKPPTNAGERRRALIGVAVVVLVLLVLAGVVYASGSGERSAKNACQQAVDRELVAPDGAGYSFSVVSQDHGSWIVSGDVDAQNRYGARIRSSFRCTVTNGTATVDSVL